MSKYQIIVVIVGAVLVVWLYSLPKIVVKNKKQLSESSTPQPSSSVHNNADSIKTVTISGEGLLKVNKFKDLLATSSDKVTKANSADSLSAIYKKNKSFDSAAIYKKIAADLLPERRNIEEAGDSFSEAASFSADPKKVTEYSEQARNYYQKVLDQAPEDLNVKSKMAMIYITTETPMQGIKMLREVVGKDPKNQLAIFNLGILSLQSNQLERASERFEKLVEINPEHWKGRFYLGLTYKQLGKNKKAREQFELVKKLENDPEVVATVNSYLQESR